MRCIFFIFLFLPLVGNSQFLTNDKAKSTVLKGLDYLYNQQFTLAEEEFKSVKSQYPNHPVHFILNAIQLQWQYMPIDKNPKIAKKYLLELEKCIEAGKELHKNYNTRKEATFFLLAAHGFIALIHNYQKDYFSAANEARKAHSYFNESKAYKTDNPEFLFSSGLYNYYREQYPISHPIVKPAVIFFENGNKKLGLEELEKSVRSSVFSRVEAALYLVNINIKYESNFRKAIIFSESLHNKYPNNNVFLIKHIETCMLNRKFIEAEALLKKLDQKKDLVSKVTSLVFEGYLEEHYHKNFGKAQALYYEAIQMPPDERYTKEYHGMAYLGLARIYKAKKDLVKSKANYKKCLEIAEYQWVVEAAKSEINKN
jgi:tetratricopeptide (TPR) repeat protein